MMRTAECRGGRNRNRRGNRRDGNNGNRLGDFMTPEQVRELRIREDMERMWRANRFARPIGHERF